MKWNLSNPTPKYNSYGSLYTFAAHVVVMVSSEALNVEDANLHELYIEEQNMSTIDRSS